MNERLSSGVHKVQIQMLSQVRQLRPFGCGGLHNPANRVTLRPQAFPSNFAEDVAAPFRTKFVN